jgi:hypothetical protein
MNITTFNANVGNLRIDPTYNCSNNHTSGSSNVSYIDNNNNNNNHNVLDNTTNYNPNNNYHTPIHSSPSQGRFAPFQSSPSMQDTSSTISFGSLNVRGLNVRSKFDSILDDLFDASISVVALQETRLFEANASAMFHQYCASTKSNLSYRAYWSFDPIDRSGGVGLLVSSFVSKYVQKVHRFHSRFIAIDLFLPAKKIKIINIYNYQRKDFHRSGLSFSKFVIEHIKQAEKDGFKVIVLGDFNLDPSVFLSALQHGRTPPTYFSLIAFLFERNYVDQHPVDASGREYATHYNHTSPTSRIDLSWFSSELALREFCFDRVWHLPCSQLSSSSAPTFGLDHRCIIVYFTKALFVGDLPIHRLKQKHEQRSYFNVAAATEDNWDDYRSHITSNLSSNHHSSSLPVHSTLPFNKQVLNSLWHTFRSTVTDAAKAHLPIKRVSPDAFKKLQDDEQLVNLRLHLRQLNRIFSFLTDLTFHSSSKMPFHQAQHLWSAHRPSNSDKTDDSDSFRSCLVAINKAYDSPLQLDDIPLWITRSSHSAFVALRRSVAGIRNHVRKICVAKENILTAERIQSFELLRCTNFATHKAAFIASSLNRTKRCIILDRAMAKSASNEDVLITDPAQIKLLAASHFQSVAGVPPVNTPSLASMSDRWHRLYSPMQSVNASIYANLTALVTDDEWNSALASLPNGKAPGLSNIPYEMLKQLPVTALSYLRDIVNLCLESSFIPSQWKDATIYPIPKPQEWNCFLQNTRPITLLDTARKLLTRIMYRRLSKALVDHQVLTGKNFAGLPGCSCDPPIATLEAIIRDASAKSKPLFIFQQDISKAFDSMDPNMLRLAMERLKIPLRFINLTLELFTGRWNTVITAYGPSAPYKVNVGIDQGEVISFALGYLYRPFADRSQ